MPASHVLLIPLILAVGVGVGWTLGARSVRNEWRRSEERRRRRELDES